MNATIPGKSPMGSMSSMDEDPYSDGEAQSKPDDKNGDKSSDKGDSLEAVLPIGILAGKHFDVGDELVLEVTGIHENEISVKYATGKGDKPEKEGEDEDVPRGTSEDEMTPGDPEYD